MEGICSGRQLEEIQSLYLQEIDASKKGRLQKIDWYWSTWIQEFSFNFIREDKTRHLKLEDHFIAT